MTTSNTLTIVLRATISLGTTQELVRIGRVSCAFAFPLFTEPPATCSPHRPSCPNSAFIELRTSIPDLLAVRGTPDMKNTFGSVPSTMPQWRVLCHTLHDRAARNSSSFFPSRYRLKLDLLPGCPN